MAQRFSVHRRITATITFEEIIVFEKREDFGAQEFNSEPSNHSASNQARFRVTESSPENFAQRSNAIERVKEYSCHICDETFELRSRLKHHIENYHQNPLGLRAKRYSCHICDDSFESRISLKHHIDNFHPAREPIKKYCCHICDETFEVRIRLKHHIENFHPIITPRKPIKKYSCHICDETFGTRINLKQHIENFHPRWFKRWIKTKKMVSTI